jgi:hypothetical protein
MDQLETAHYWLDRGMSTIPLQMRGKKPDPTALRLTGDTDAGRPTWIKYQRQLPDNETLRRWFGGPRKNIALITGWENLVVLDFDNFAAYDAYLSVVRGTACSVGAGAYKVLTARGVHVYFQVDEPVANGHCGLIDIKAAGGYVLIPPSIHPSGRAYVAMDPTATIPHIERLSDVFPFVITQAPTGTPPHPTEQPRQPTAYDPWLDAQAARSHSEGLVETIHQHFRIEDLMPDLEKSGRGWLKGCCPFHDDREPSFWVDTQKQICGCRAGCNGSRPWDVINLYARLHGLSDREAIEEMRRVA